MPVLNKKPPVSTPTNAPLPTWVLNVISPEPLFEISKVSEVGVYFIVVLLSARDVSAPKLNVTDPCVETKSATTLVGFLTTRSEEKTEVPIAILLMSTG